MEKYKEFTVEDIRRCREKFSNDTRLYGKHGNRFVFYTTYTPSESDYLDAFAKVIFDEYFNNNK